MQNELSFSYARDLARISLEIGAIKLNPKIPFTWASGYQMPIYNDNRLLLGNADHRLFVAQGLENLLKQGKIPVDVIAGTATAGIPPATSLANLIQTPLVYIRPKPKEHGMQNQVEGIMQNGQNIVVVEDLISTGGSALQAVEAVRQAGGLITDCICIFNYGFAKARESFEKINCRLHSLLTFDFLLEYAEQEKTISPEQITLLRNWHKNPFEWAKKK